MLTNLGKNLDHLVDLTRIKFQSTVVDAGACEGHFVDAMKHHGFHGSIHMLECNPTNIEVLRNRMLNRTLNYYAKLYEVALVGQEWPENTAAKFHEFVGLPEWGNITGIHLDTKHPKLQKIHDHHVEVVRINDLFDFLKVDYIDYLKMDIEGSEGEVIETMTSDTAMRIGQLSFEVHDNVDRGQVIKTLEQFFDHVQQKGDEIYAGR